MRPALAAIADDGNLLSLDEIEIGIAIIVNAHFLVLPLCGSEAASNRRGFCSIKSEKLPRRLGRIPADLRVSHFKPVA